VHCAKRKAQGRKKAGIGKSVGRTRAGAEGNTELGLPETCAVVSAFGNLKNIRMTRRANALVRGFNSCGVSLRVIRFY
jgi:hypothetical protein